MNTVLIEKGSCKMVAHRGVSGLELENTCAAFVAAGVKSYYGIETDVHVTSDGKYVIFHDNDMKRIAGVDLVIEKTDFERIRSVRLPDKDGETYRSDLIVPTLEDYIAVCRKYDKVAVLELKNYMEPRHVEAIASVVKKMGWFEKTTFISFCADNLIVLRKLYADASIQLLADKLDDACFELMKKYRFDADLHGKFVTGETVSRLHAAGIKVNCWTIDDPNNAAELIAMGVDFITSNILE